MLNTGRLCFQILSECEHCIASSASGECVRDVGLTTPSCVEKAGAAFFVFQVAVACGCVAKQLYIRSNARMLPLLDENI